MADTPSHAVTQDDSLPPVEPPSPAFLVPLFVVPGLIVGALLGLFWLGASFSQQSEIDAAGYLRALRRPSEGRWQAAFNLASDLRGPGGDALKKNVALASELGAILDDEMASGRPEVPDKDGGTTPSQELCIYLCRALGEFTVPEAAPPLVARAAADSPVPIRRAAVEALAVLRSNLKAARATFADPAAVTAAVLEASRADDAGLRSSAAFALGVIGGDEVVARLLEIDADAAESVRYNAATSLARLGRREAYDTLAEMLALSDEPPKVDDASQRDAARAARYHRVLVVVNALNSVNALVDAGEPPPESMAALLARLADDPSGDVRAAATVLRDKCDRAAAAQP